MSCNSAIYMVNNQSTDITTTTGTYAMVPLGNVVRRFGKRLRFANDAIEAYCSGYFIADVNCVLAPEATGEITVQLFQDGFPVPGASATRTVSTAGNVTSFSIPALVRNCGCDCNSRLEVGVNASCTVENLATRVEAVKN